MAETTRQAKERGFWDRQAPGYDQRSFEWFETAYRRSVEKARSVVSPEQQVLEIGCGTGIISLGIAPHVRHVIGTDIAPEMVAVARRKAETAGMGNVEFHVHDGYALPYDDASFDAVLLFNILHVVQEPAALMREAHRLLKPGGHLVTATDCYAEPVPLKARLYLTAQRLLKVTGAVPFLAYYRRADLHRLFQEN
ncbi:MAG TPA: class I SAM-dependent methyltransferase, partial [Anaerolineae bacterium]|nr:class I SAM-dependent methyltransferase [Anaerolineae bacterium]